MMNRWILGGAVLGGLALGGLVYSFFRGKAAKAAALKKATDADAKSQALKKAYDAGCADGKLDGIADSGKVHNPRMLLNYDDKVAANQQQYENGYNDCYEKHWVPPPKVDTTKDATPSPGGAKGRTPYQYGCDRGTSTGYADAMGGYERDSWKVNLASSGSLKRQAESGNPAEYRRGYEKCYLAAFDGAKFGKSAADVISVPSAEGGGGFVSGVAGAARPPFLRTSWVN